MALSDIILPAGKVIVIKSNSGIGIASAGQALNFGIVQAVNDLCDVTTVGTYVMFDLEKATPFTIISGTIFYMVDESDLSFNEVAI